MVKYFKTEDGKIVNLIDHCNEVITKNPLTSLLIATDSQNSKSKKNKTQKQRKPLSKYSTVVVFRYENKGAHYIYLDSNFPKITDLFKRLFKECELSLEIAEYITQNTIFKIEAIELDYNNIKLTKSTPLIAATKGWVESLGYKAILKSGEMIASKAADKCCRN